MHVFCLMLMKGGILPLSFSLSRSLALARAVSLALLSFCRVDVCVTQALAVFLRSFVAVVF